MYEHMSLALGWGEILVRLLCAVVAGAALGLNRTEHGHAAGLRTSILVTLAACVAMLQMNLLLPLAGRASDSFIMNDLMRLPLGILTGVGFIGGGAIIRRDNLTVGVTTAATLWFLTTLGLCFGGGQVALGLAGTVIGLIVLTLMKTLERRMKQDKQGKLVIVADRSGPTEDEIRAILEQGGFHISALGFVASSGAENRELDCDLRWRALAGDTSVPPALALLARREGILRVAWAPQARSEGAGFAVGTRLRGAVSKRK
jgi:putative Mg2+ transporter-C (MgtC) family protein